jgi:choline-sulfatase
MSQPTNFWGPFTQAPNLLILMTDQQRTTQHMPRDWVKNNLPNLWALQQGGVSFPNAMTNSTACSPSRATLWTSTYPTLNGVIAVGDTLNLPQNIVTGPEASSLPLATLGQVLATFAPSGIDYQIAYKGKWHLTSDFASGLSASQQETEASTLAGNDSDMVSTYGYPGWTSPDFGTYMDTSSNPNKLSQFGINTLAGGLGGNDARITSGTSYTLVDGETATVENAVQFLNNYTPNGQGTNPFCLVVSLLNPHDIFVSPFLYEQAGYNNPDKDGNQPWQVAPFTEIQLPHNYTLTADQLAAKPAAQWAWQNQSFGTTPLTDDQALDYLRFYAYLETLSDAMLGEVMAAMNTSVATNTLVVRLADHGEMGMSQGGMREKEENAYKETLLVPMIFSNPGLPQGASCLGLAGLIDVLPTLAEICGISDLSSTYAVQGQSIASAILNGDSGETYHKFLFATDDATTPIRCLVEDQHHHAKYAVYYDKTPVQGNPNGSSANWQCELYRFSSDPTARDAEMTNHIPVLGLQTGDPASSKWAQSTWRAMHEQLTTAMTDTNTLPENWPPPPAAPSDSN